jgi:hypothetical protein
MDWILILWLNTPSNYTVHSHYATQAECLAKEEYYNIIYDKIGTKLTAACVSSKFQKFAKSKNQLVYSSYTVGGYSGR